MAPKSSDRNRAVESIVLCVPDGERVARFYERIVGLERLEGAGEGHWSLGSSDGDEIVGLLEDEEAPERSRTEAGLFHLAIRFPDRRSLAEALRRVEESDARLVGASDHRVSEALYLADPAGNGVELYADRPASEWTYSGGEVEMTTERLDLGALRAETGAGVEEAAPAGTDLGHVHLEVTDLDRAVAFYSDGLGMDVQARRPGAAFLSFDGYHHHVGLNTWNGRSRPRTSDGLGVRRIGLCVSDSDLRRMRERSDAPDDRSEEVYADPDGISWRLRS